MSAIEGMPITRVIELAVDVNRFRAVGVSVCNALNLDPRLTIGELWAMAGDRTWAATHEERLAELAKQVKVDLAQLAITDPQSPFITGRPRGDD